MFYDLEDGIKKIQENDRESQKHFIGVLIESRFKDSLRKTNSPNKNLIEENYRQRIDNLVDYIIDLGCFFVPNNDYMTYFFGKSCTDQSVACYDWEGCCVWLGQLVIPIRGALGNLEGFAGFNPLHKTIREDNLEREDKEPLPPKYTLSNKNVFDRSTHLFIPNGYKKMLEDDYAIPVDGIFDSIILASIGYNSVCNLGSYLNEKTLFPLSLVSRRWVAHDNDKAGLDFFGKIQKVLPKTSRIVQVKFKDIDEYLRVFGYNNFITKMNSVISSGFLEEVVL